MELQGDKTGPVIVGKLTYFYYIRWTSEYGEAWDLIFSDGAKAYQLIARYVPGDW